jgi:replication factor C subunit 2/4
VCAVLRECLARSDLPNLLLYGPPGTGKTSTILAAARQLFGEFFKDRVLELNASDDRGIAVIRTKVKNFAQLKASSIRPDGKPCPSFKIIILDEADAMTHAAQAALRRTMEKETRTTRFCLVCNYVSRIIEPITSRCTKFRFTLLGIERIVERLKEISDTEKVNIEEKALKDVVDVSCGDMRKAITTLQSCYRLKCGLDASHKITHDDVLEMSGIVPQKYLKEFIDICRKGDFTKLEDFVEQFMFEAYSISQFFDQMNDFIVHNETITNNQKNHIFDKMGESAFRLLNGGSEYIQLMDFGTASIIAFKK